MMNCFQSYSFSVSVMDIGRAMRPGLISCVFCRCQIPTSATQAKYKEHLQVKLALLF